MSDNKANADSKALPKPITLTPEQIQQIAAGTAGSLPATVLQRIFAGPYPVGPLLSAANIQTVAAPLAGANFQFGG